MRLISSKRTKRRIALLFVFAFVLSNLLSLFGPSANAAVTPSVPSPGLCFQHTGSGTVASGANVTIYSIGQLNISALVNDLSPGADATASGSANSAAARATDTAGTISDSTGAIIGNLVTIVPPTGTNFVIVPGFQDTGAASTSAGTSNLLQAANATITNAQSTDASTGGPDSNLDISVGVITAGTAGVGRAIIAIARDADTSGVSFAGGTESYPKSGTGNNTATISINGLGIAIPPSANVSLSGTLTASFDPTPPAGIATGASQGNTRTYASAIPSIGGTVNLCTVTNASGQIEAVLDSDDDSSDLYDRNAASANILALGQIGTLTRVHVFDSATTTASNTVDGNAGAILDIEPILIRGKAGTGSSTRDQVIATGELVTNIDTGAKAPSATGLTLTDTAIFGNAAIAPITVTFSDDNAAATSTLNAVSIILSSSNAGSAPSQAGFSATRTARHGWLGALRAAVHAGGDATSAAQYADGARWGVATVTGNDGGSAGLVTVQESALAGNTDTGGAGGLANGRSANSSTANEPSDDSFVDLFLFCSSTNPVAGWFATLNSASNDNFSTNGGAFQQIAKTQAGNLILVNSMTQNFFTQGLTNINGSTSTSGIDTNAPTWRSGNAVSETNNLQNAILYASCASNQVTLFPIQNAFDGQRDIIAIHPRLSITNISNTFASDVSILAEISGNNLATTALTLGKLIGVPPTGQDSTLASASGVALAGNGELGVDCSSGTFGSVVLGGVATGTVATAVTNTCTSGAIAVPPPLFTGGANATVSGTTVIDGSPVAQGESRGILVQELTATGFNELTNQVGGGTQGTVFEVQLPSGCDIVDDNDDNNTASSTSTTSGMIGGNDVTRVTATTTAGIGVHFSGGTGDALITDANSLEPASGSNVAKIRFGLTMAAGTSTDGITTDAVLVRLDSQDILCPTSISGMLEAPVVAQNKISSPTIVAKLGKASLGTATKAFSFGFADDVATSTKGETSTNTGIGVTPRTAATGSGVTTSHALAITELDPKGFPIGGRVSSRNIDPENNLLTTQLNRAQIWIVPERGTEFGTAPTAMDVTFSDTSLAVDGTPTIVTSATVDGNPPIGTLSIGIKKNTASGSAAPETSTTTVTVKNLKIAAATSSTGPLTVSVEVFQQDVGAVVNTGGVASANSATTPTLFTPFVQGGTKARTQLETAGAQVGTGSTANQLLTSRLTTLETPQLNPFATVVSTLKNADSSKISLTAAALASGATPATDNVVTVTGANGTVDNGAEVVVSTGGATPYDSVTVVSNKDGGFTAKVRGDCATSMSITVNVTEQVSGVKTTAATKTVICGSSTAGGGETVDSVFNDIAGSDGTASVDEVLTYVKNNGGLAAIILAGGAKFDGVVKAAKAALGLS